MRNSQTADDLFWEEFENDFEDYAASQQDRLTNDQLLAEKQLAEDLLNRRLNA